MNQSPRPANTRATNGDTRITIDLPIDIHNFTSHRRFVPQINYCTMIQQNVWNACQTIEYFIRFDS